MKAFITGISGFVGTYLSEKLLECSYDVVGISRAKSITNKNVNYISCDITNFDELKKILTYEKPDEIYHLAGSAFIPESFKEPITTYNTIVKGTLNLFEAVKYSNINPKILFVGSAEVYGSGTGVPIKEMDPFQLNNPYAGSKACAEMICNQYIQTNGMNIVRVRPFNHTGPGQSSNYVCSSFAKQIVELERKLSNVINVGNINVKRDFLDVRDVVEAYYMIMQSGISNEVYNVSSQKGVTIAELLNYLVDYSDLTTIDIKVDERKVRPNETLMRVGDNTKITDEIGWRPQMPLQQTMIDLLEYWRMKN